MGEAVYWKIYLSRFISSWKVSDLNRVLYKFIHEPNKAYFELKGSCEEFERKYVCGRKSKRDIYVLRSVIDSWNDTLITFLQEKKWCSSSVILSIHDEQVN